MNRLPKLLLGLLTAGFLLVGCQSSPPASSSDQLPSIPPVLTITDGQAAAAPTAGAGGEAPAGMTPDPSGAVLGAPEQAFITRLGKPGPNSVAGQEDHFGQPAGSSCDAFVVTFVQNHARAILRHGCASAAPDIDQRLNEATTFLPTDTLVGKAMQTAKGDEGTINTSASLAKALPADAFRDCNQHALTPGTFAVVLTADGWVVSAGLPVTGLPFLHRFSLPGDGGRA